MTIDELVARSITRTRKAVGQDGARTDREAYNLVWAAISELGYRVDEASGEVVNGEAPIAVRHEYPILKTTRVRRRR